MLLELKDFSLSFARNEVYKPLFRPIDLALAPNGAIGIVGPSGIGKTSIAKAIMGILPDGFSIIGQMRYKGMSLEKESDFAAIRGREVGYIFQEPQAHLNPVATMEKHFTEIFESFMPGLGKLRQRLKIVELLQDVGFKDPEEVMKKYPFQLSGGMAQRVYIALVLAVCPSLVIADEPTSALDEKSAKDTLGLIKRLKDEREFGLLVISHNERDIEALCEGVVELEID